MKFSSQKPSKKNQVISKRADKKNIGIKWNSARCFQIGVIVCMLLSFGIINMSFKVTDLTYKDYDAKTIEPDISIGAFVLEDNRPKEMPKKDIVEEPKKETKIIDKIIEKDNTVAGKETNTATTEVTTKPTNTTTKNTTPDKPAVKDEGPTSLIAVEKVPVFPGCEGAVSRKAKIDCMSSKIGKFVSRKFNTDKFSYLDDDKVHRIYVQFTIGSDGVVKDIKSKAKEEALEKEAYRVINKLPQMTPGKQGDKSVDVVYMIPIGFKTAN